MLFRASALSVLPGNAEEGLCLLYKEGKARPGMEGETFFRGDLFCRGAGGSGYFPGRKAEVGSGRFSGREKIFRGRVSCRGKEVFLFLSGRRGCTAWMDEAGVRRDAGREECFAPPYIIS